MLKLKLQYFVHLIWTADSLEKFLMLGKIEDRRRKEHQRMRWLDSISDAMDMNLSKLQEMVRDREAWHAVVHGVEKSWTRLDDWITTIKHPYEAILNIYIKKIRVMWRLNGYLKLFRISYYCFRWEKGIEVRVSKDSLSFRYTYWPIVH